MESIPKFNLEMISVMYDFIGVLYWSKEYFLKTEDPVESSTVQLFSLAHIAKELEGIKVSNGGEEMVYKLVKCLYCSTKFLLNKILVG